MGSLLSHLPKVNIANPIILIDEIDKSTGSSQYTPMSGFYALLEPHSAKRFKDEALEIELAASQVIWIATANNSHGIPDPSI